MWSTIKRNGFYIFIVFFISIMGINFYVVDQGIIDKADNWLTMFTWACMFLVYWIIEMFSARKHRKDLHEIIDIGYAQAKLTLKLAKENFELTQDNQALIKENIRLEQKQKIKPIRERTHD